MTKRRLIDMNQAADYLGVKKPTLYSWVFQRKIPFIKVGRLVKFDLNKLEEWLEYHSFEERQWNR